jgi:Ricin-type beta-trefoil lectin domain
LRFAILGGKRTPTFEGSKKFTIDINKCFRHLDRRTKSHGENQMTQASKAMVASALAVLAAASCLYSPGALAADPLPWQNVATQRCLDSNSGGDAYTLGCNGGGFQLWKEAQSGFGQRIRNQQTGRCLDSNTQGQVYTLPCNGGAFQQWVIVYKGAGWEIKNVATGRCLDSNTSGQLYTLGCNGGNFQRWY